MNLDYRNFTYSLNRIRTTGLRTGKYSFPKLYFIENALRVIVNTVLSNEIHPNWWDSILSSGFKNKAQKEENNHVQYLSVRRPRFYSSNHSIHFIYLSQLITIAGQNSHLFVRLFSDFDKYITDLELFRQARNYTCHMNYPAYEARKIVDKAFRKTLRYMRTLEGKYEILIP